MTVKFKGIFKVNNENELKDLTERLELFSEHCQVVDSTGEPIRMNTFLEVLVSYSSNNQNVTEISPIVQKMPSLKYDSSASFEEYAAGVTPHFSVTYFENKPLHHVWIEENKYIVHLKPAREE